METGGRFVIFAVTKNREATVADLFTIVVVVVVLFLALGLHLC